MSTELVVIRHSYKSVTVDNKMGNKKRPFQYSHDFLHNEDLIRWRLFQTNESDIYQKENNIIHITKIRCLWGK